MTTITIKSHRELKELWTSNRNAILNINGVDFQKNYIDSLSRKHAWYYDEDKKGGFALYAPFMVTMQ